jgi:hypothetical protein
VIENKKLCETRKVKQTIAHPFNHAAKQLNRHFRLRGKDGEVDALCGYL